MNIWQFSCLLTILRFIFSTYFPCKYAYRRCKELISKYFESLYFKKHMLSILWLRNRQSTYRDIYIKQVNNKETKGESLFLTHFMPIVSFYTPWKHRKTRGFLFSRGQKETSGMKWVNNKFAGNRNFILLVQMSFLKKDISQ